MFKVLSNWFDYAPVFNNGGDKGLVETFNKPGKTIKPKNKVTPKK